MKYQNITEITTVPSVIDTDSVVVNRDEAPVQINVKKLAEYVKGGLSADSESIIYDVTKAVGVLNYGDPLFNNIQDYIEYIVKSNTFLYTFFTEINQDCLIGGKSFNRNNIFYYGKKFDIPKLPIFIYQNFNNFRTFPNFNTIFDKLSVIIDGVKHDVDMTTDSGSVPITKPITVQRNGLNILISYSLKSDPENFIEFEYMMQTPFINCRFEYPVIFATSTNKNVTNITELSNFQLFFFNKSYSGIEGNNDTEYLYCLKPDSSMDGYRSIYDSKGVVLQDYYGSPIADGYNKCIINLPPNGGGPFYDTREIKDSDGNFIFDQNNIFSMPMYTIQRVTDYKLSSTDLIAYIEDSEKPGFFPTLYSGNDNGGISIYDN